MAQVLNKKRKFRVKLHVVYSNNRHRQLNIIVEAKNEAEAARLAEKEIKTTRKEIIKSTYLFVVDIATGQINY